MSDTIAALQFEREGYVRRGLTGRVRQVDEQIARLSGSAVVVLDVGGGELVETAVVVPALERAVAGKSRRR